MPHLTREEMVEALKAALLPLDYVHAMWEGGSTAFGRTDQWSDLDLQVETDDERVDEAMEVIANTLAGLSQIEARYDVPPAAAFGHTQAFFRLRDAGRFLLVDLCVIKRSNPSKFLEPEIHGRAVFHFNKNEAVTIPTLDWPEHLKRLEARRQRVRARFDMFSSMFEKELNRKNSVGAVDLYFRLLLDSLIDALRIRHCPARFDFKTGYLRYDLPAPVLVELEPLFFVAGLADLREKGEHVRRWFLATIDSEPGA
jgi:hypothetical protein